MTEEERKQRHRENSKRWWANNRKKAAESNRKWAAKNPDAHRAIRRRTCRKTMYNYLDAAYTWNEVEGFDNWTINTEVHHRLEMFGFTAKELKEQGRYFNCCPDELVCLTRSEHSSLHGYLRSLTKKNP